MRLRGWPLDVGHEAVSARCFEEWAVQEHVVYRLDRLAAGASHLFWGVLKEEPLHARPYKSVSCNDAVKGAKVLRENLTFWPGPGRPIIRKLRPRVCCYG
jgi:hypothetical protein